MTMVLYIHNMFTMSKKIISNKKASALSSFSDIRVAVIGDSMLDTFITGSVTRISPEAPIPIVKHQKETNHPGGAANVAHNIASLGGKVTLITILGDDDAGELLLTSLREAAITVEYALVDPLVNTIQKTRILAHGQHMLRIDKETIQPLSVQNEKTILTKFLHTIDDYHVVILSDYAKGFLTKTLVHGIKKVCLVKNIPIIVDPKPENITLYKGVTLITPNHKEITTITKEIDAHKAAKILQKNIGSAVLVTLGSDGMYLLDGNKDGIAIEAQAQEVFDVSGAGDTVIATLALCIAQGHTLQDAAYIANIAAGIVVGKSGTATVTFKELSQFLKKSK